MSTEKCKHETFFVTTEELYKCWENANGEYHCKWSDEDVKQAVCANPECHQELEIDYTKLNF